MSRDERQDVNKVRGTSGEGLPSRGKGVKDVKISTEPRKLTDIFKGGRPVGYQGKHRS